MEARRFGLATQSRAEVKKLTATIAVLATLARTNVNRVTAASGDDAYDTEGNEPEEWQRLTFLQYVDFSCWRAVKGVSRSKVADWWNTVTSFARNLFEVLVEHCYRFLVVSDGVSCSKNVARQRIML